MTNWLSLVIFESVLTQIQSEAEMGFQAKLVLLYPEEEELPPKTPADEESGRRTVRKFWKSQESIDFGHITRLEKLIDPRLSHVGHSSHRRAGICVMSVFLEPLFEMMYKADLKVFAPKFIIYNDYAERVLRFDEIAETEVQIDWDSDESLPEEMAKHNEILNRPQKEISRISAKHEPRLSPPFMWESCSTLAVQLDECEASHSEEWQALEKDPVSLALARGWREYLREVGRVGVQALFVFPF